MTTFRMTVTVSTGAGGDKFAAKVLDAIEKDESVYIQVAGECGHLRIDALRNFEANDYEPGDEVLNDWMGQ